MKSPNLAYQFLTGRSPPASRRTAVRSPVSGSLQVHAAEGAPRGGQAARPRIPGKRPSGS